MRSPFSPLSKRIEGGKLMQTGHLWCSTPVGATSISTRIRNKYIADKNDSYVLPTFSACEIQERMYKPR